MSETACLALRLAGPLQSWGITSQHNRRETGSQPSKSGVLGLLAAAQGRRRGESIEDLLALRLGVRVDQPGSLLRDYHTVSTLDGSPLLSAAVNAKGVQKPSSGKNKKTTQVTRRYYLQDAVFVVILEGPEMLIHDLAEAVQRPAYFLSLGRRSCVPEGNLLIASEGGFTHRQPLDDLLHALPWQVSPERRAKTQGQSKVVLAATFDAQDGEDLVADVPVNYAPDLRGFTTRRVTHTWVTLPTGFEDAPDAHAHDPFALLGW